MTIHNSKYQRTAHPKKFMQKQFEAKRVQNWKRISKTKQRKWEETK